jgi:hypothetical protein
VVLERGSAFQGLVISQFPRTSYHQYEVEDWAGLKVTEVTYGGDPQYPPQELVFAWPDAAITVGAIDRSIPGSWLLFVIIIASLCAIWVKNSIKNISKTY